MVPRAVLVDLAMGWCIGHVSFSAQALARGAEIAFADILTQQS